MRDIQEISAIQELLRENTEHMECLYLGTYLYTNDCSIVFS